jgi:mRNA-degrading endonuclease RelE of RelBE toxin-antitoxin system
MTPLPPKLLITSHKKVEDDLRNLPTKFLQQVAVDLIYAISRGEIRGQSLQLNTSTGDLSGFFKIYFDTNKDRSPRYRIVYRLLSEKVLPNTLYIIAVGEREDLKVYKDAIARLNKLN